MLTVGNVGVFSAVNFRLSLRLNGTQLHRPWHGIRLNRPSRRMLSAQVTATLIGYAGMTTKTERVTATEISHSFERRALQSIANVIKSDSAVTNMPKCL